MNRQESAALDRHITGNYGEDQFAGWGECENDVPCPEAGLPGCKWCPACVASHADRGCSLSNCNKPSVDGVLCADHEREQAQAELCSPSCHQGSHADVSGQAVVGDDVVADVVRQLRWQKRRRSLMYRCLAFAVCGHHDERLWCRRWIFHGFKGRDYLGHQYARCPQCEQGRQ